MNFNFFKRLQETLYIMYIINIVILEAFVRLFEEATSEGEKEKALEYLKEYIKSL